MTSAVDASPKERRIGLLWGIFISGLENGVVPCSLRTIQSVAGYPPKRYLHAVPSPAPPRPEDLPLHDDVRWLAGALGRVIRRLEGEESFTIVERLRVATRARRHG